MYKSIITIVVCLVLGISGELFATSVTPPGGASDGEGPLVVQNPGLNQAMNAYRITSRNQLRIRNELMLAKKNGLPDEPLVDKVYEGMAKRVDQDRIVAAVERVRMRYEHAWRHTERMAWADPSAADTFAELLVDSQVAGLTEEDTNRLMNRLRTQTRDRDPLDCQKLRLRVMEMTRTMARHRVHSSTVTDLVVETLDAEYSTGDMQRIENAFTNNVRYNHANSLAAQYAAAIQNGASASAVASGNGYGHEGKNSRGSGGGNQGGGGGNGNGNSGGDRGGNSSGSGNGGNDSGSSRGEKGQGNGSGGSGGGKGSSGQGRGKG